MTTVKIKLSFDITGKEIAPTVFAKQWDNLTRRLVIALEENGGVFVAPKNATVFLRGKKQDGAVFYITGNPTENKGEYEFLLGKNALSAEGQIRCDVAYSYAEGDETPVCSTNAFYIDNTLAACCPDDYEAEDEFQSIEEFIAKGNEALEKLYDAMEEAGKEADKEETEIQLFAKRSGKDSLIVPDISANNHNIEIHISETDTSSGAIVGVPSNNIYNYENNFAGYDNGIDYMCDGCELTFVGAASAAGNVVVYEPGTFPFANEDIVFSVCGNAEDLQVDISAEGGFSALLSPNQSIAIPAGTISSGEHWGITVKCTNTRRYNGEKLYLMFNYGSTSTTMCITDVDGIAEIPAVSPKMRFVCLDSVITAVYKYDIVDLTANIPDVGMPIVNIHTNSAKLKPNIFYVFPEMLNISIDLGGVVDYDRVQEYRFRFVSGSTPTTLTLPEAVSGDITVNANSVVEVSIIDNYAVSQSWAVE